MPQEMKLTREQIEEMRRRILRSFNVTSNAPDGTIYRWADVLCDMALASLSARDGALEEAILALRNVHCDEERFGDECGIWNSAIESGIKAIRALRSPAEQNAVPDRSPAIQTEPTEHKDCCALNRAPMGLGARCDCGLDDSPDRGVDVMPDEPEYPSDECSKDTWILRLERWAMEMQNYALELRQWALRRPAPRDAGYPEGCTPVDIEVLRKANVDLAAEVERLKTGLRFYAHGHHWINELHDDKWDTCSGEPQNWWWRDNEEESAEGIEDGGVARVYLSGQEPDWEGEPPLEHQCEPGMKEILAAAPNEERG